MIQRNIFHYSVSGCAISNALAQGNLNIMLKSPDQPIRLIACHNQPDRMVRPRKHTSTCAYPYPRQPVTCFITKCPRSFLENTPVTYAYTLFTSDPHAECMTFALTFARDRPLYKILLGRPSEYTKWNIIWCEKWHVFINKQPPNVNGVNVNDNVE